MLKQATDNRLGWTTLDSELDPVPLPVEGEIPAWLEGALVRNGPAKYEVGGQPVRHWFDGYAMLHKFGLARGEVTYSNRYLRTKAYAAASEGRIGYREFASDPCRSIFRRFTTLFAPSSDFTDNAAVNLVRLGDRFIAMTETPMPIEFDPATLETLGVAAYEDDLGGGATTAHPHADPLSGDLVNYFTRFGPRTTYRIYRQSPSSSRRELIAELPAREPAYMHSFGISEHYVVLVEFPLVVNPVKLAVGGRPFIEAFRWEPERGARFHVIDSRDGSLRTTAEADAFFSFHHVNAYEEGDELVVDLSAYEDSSIIDALYLDNVRSDDGYLPPPYLRRYRVPLDGGRATWEQIGDQSIELPRIDYRRHNGRPYRYTWGVGGVDSSVRDLGGRLVKIDTHDGSARTWEEPDCFAGEPVFVPSPDQRAEDHGVALSVVLDSAKERSFLLVLDAATMEELGRAEAPHHVPFGFHGQYLGGVA